MTDLDLTPAGLRKLAQECVNPDTSALGVLLECCRTLRALADQMEEEPSEAEVEAALDAWDDGRFDWRGNKDADAARQCMSRTLKVAYAAKAKEMGL